MAESADILSGDHQQVILPNLAAGCSMADMAQTDDVLDCWAQLQETLGPDHGIVPVTYMNSAAALKAFCGKNGGVVCTSSNARAVLAWALERGKRVLFFPDQHLGRNTALGMGYGIEDTAVWAPGKDLGGNTPEQLEAATFILWKGHCSVHGRFRPEQVLAARERFPEVRVVVHPECTREVVQLADCNGSTEYIIKVVAESPAGSVWAVGTEINLVNRLQQEHPDKTVFCLDPVICPCSTMYRIHPAYLSWALDHLVAGEVVNRVRVDEEVARWARVALDRMLEIK
jgi:quinolinate synthase